MYLKGKWESDWGMEFLVFCLGFVFGSMGSSILIHSSAGGRSHAKAMLEVGHVLAGRGHSVRYVAVDDNLKYADDYDITPVGLGHEGLFSGAMLGKLDLLCGGKVGDESMACAGPVVSWWMKECYRHEYSPLQEHVQHDRPDVMICDLFAYSCNDVAIANGIPLIMGLQSIDWLNLFNMPYVAKDTRFGPLTIEGMSSVELMVDTLMVPYYLNLFWSSITNAINIERSNLGLPQDWSPTRVFHYGLGLSSSFFGFEVPQHLPPNVKTIGPILSSHVPPIGESIADFLSEHKKVLYIGFGSLISLHQKEISAIYNGALTALDEGLVDGVIWGLGRTPKPNTTDTRFRLLRWAPQQSILNHPSTVVFLSHGGIESSFEAIHSATATITIPFFTDQSRNAAKLQEMGVGLYIDPTNIHLSTSIRTLLKRPNLKAKLAKAQALTNPHRKRLQEAANHVEDHLELAAVCRQHEPYHFTEDRPPCELSHLLPASTRLSFFQANRIDIYLKILLTAASVLMTFLLLSRTIRRTVNSK